MAGRGPINPRPETKKIEVEKDLEAIVEKADKAKQPNLFGARDELISAINIEMADLTERAEAIAKRIEATEKQREDLEGRLHNLRRINEELQKPHASAKG
ncbi:MAG: hypothetical protein A2Y86_05185 [Candidatus Aminicenantes bacterium RBG_13_62_12]|nr:MAG: hypothetical protein A2Y86_05185 [Candidatus Aminicenantes bacterium RBG_13_62_12]